MMEEIYKRMSGARWKHARMGIDARDKLRWHKDGNEWCGELIKQAEKEYAMEFITGDSYADRNNRVCRFIGKIDDLLFFLDENNQTIRRNADGSHKDRDLDSFDIVRHVKPKVKRKGFAYMFKTPQNIYGITGCIGVIRGGDDLSKCDYINACVPIEVEYSEGEGLA